MKNLYTEFYDFAKAHTGVLLITILVLTITLIWNFERYKEQQQLDEIYQTLSEGFQPTTITIEELLTTRIKKINKKLDDETVAQYVDWIVKYAPQYGLDPFLIVGVISTESFWNKNLVSSADCIGLMQVNYKVWKKDLQSLGITRKEDLFNPEQNIKAGCYILGSYLAKYKGDTIKALQGYLGSQKALWYSQRVGLYSIK